METPCPLASQKHKRCLFPSLNSLRATFLAKCASKCDTPACLFIGLFFFALRSAAWAVHKDRSFSFKELPEGLESQKSFDVQLLL